MRRWFIAVLLLLPGACATGQPTIEWDQSTLRLVAEDADYGRMTRLGDGRIGCVFDRDAKMWIRHSSDEGATWAEPILVAQEKDCWLTNADLLACRNGELLYFWNERPMEAVRRQEEKPPPTDLKRSFLIRMSRSADHGQTWSPPQTIYTAGPLFGDGCWEPAAIELPSGELHVYFANESPYRGSNEQEISRLRSSDGGKTWSDAERVAFRAKHRDGMPAPLLLANGKIVVGIEDDGISGGIFKPVIVASDSERWSALAEPLDPKWYGGAPFLRQLPTREVVLSYQESPNGNLHRCRTAVCIGDANAREFTNKTYPFPEPQRGNQSWNSLFVKNAGSLTAITRATINDKRGVWAIDGRIR